MENFESVRKAVEHHNEISDERRDTDEYRLDRYDASEYFALFPKWKKTIEKYFAKLHNKGEEVVHLDVCGRADAQRMGADKSYLFSLKASEYRKDLSRPNNIFVDGDVFNPNDVRALTKKLEEDNISPALITFEPVAGLQAHDPTLGHEDIPEYEAITYAQLGKVFGRMIRILKPGGYFYIAKPFQSMGISDFLQRLPQEQFEMSKKIKEMSADAECEVEVGKDIGGPYFLIHKPIRKILTTQKG